MHREPLTEIAYKALSVIQARAQSEGLDLFEELNRYGLIASEPRIKEIQVSALRNMIARLEMIEPGELIRMISRSANPGTPSDMYANILQWMRTYATAVENE